MRGTPITGVSNRIDRFVFQQEDRHGLPKVEHMWKQMTVMAVAIGHTKRETPGKALNRKADQPSVYGPSLKENAASHVACRFGEDRIPK